MSNNNNEDDYTSNLQYGYSGRPNQYFIRTYLEEEGLGGITSFFSPQQFEKLLQQLISHFEKIEGRPFDFQGIQSYEFRQEEKKRKRDD